MTEETIDVFTDFTSDIAKIDLTDFRGSTTLNSTTFSGETAKELFDGDYVQTDEDGDG